MLQEQQDPVITEMDSPYPRGKEQGRHQQQAQQHIIGTERKSLCLHVEGFINSQPDLLATMLHCSSIDASSPIASPPGDGSNASVPERSPLSLDRNIPGHAPLSGRCGYSAPPAKGRSPAIA